MHLLTPGGVGLNTLVCISGGREAWRGRTRRGPQDESPGSDATSALIFDTAFSISALKQDGTERNRRRSQSQITFNVIDDISTYLTSEEDEDVAGGMSRMNLKDSINRSR